MVYKCVICQSCIQQQVLLKCQGNNGFEIRQTFNPGAHVNAFSVTTWTGCASSTQRPQTCWHLWQCLKILHGVILIMKVLILPSCCVPFIQDPFSSQPDKLNLLQPDSPADFTACFVYSTSCFYLAEAGLDKWHESTAIGATTTTFSTSCCSYKSCGWDGAFWTVQPLVRLIVHETNEQSHTWSNCHTAWQHLSYCIPVKLKWADSCR